MVKGLSKASIYEQLFGTRYKGVGRPSGDTEPLFASTAELKEIDPVIVETAKRRAYAVVHEEQRGRLQEVFGAELKVLRRRGAEAVLADRGDLKGRRSDRRRKDRTHG